MTDAPAAGDLVLVIGIRTSRSRPGALLEWPT